MKFHNIYYIISAGLLLAACTEKEQDVLSDDSQKGDFSIEATILQSADTKTWMDDSDKTKPYPVYWQKDDKIAIGYTGNFTEYTIKDGFEGKEKGLFKGKDAPKPVDGTSVYALCYPTTNAAAAVNGDVIEIGNTLSDSQEYCENSFANNTLPMAGASKNANKYDCRNLGGLIQIPVTGESTIKQIILISNGDEKMSGPVSMKFDQSTGEPIESSVVADYNYELVRPSEDEGSNKVTLNLGDDGVTLDSSTPTEFNFVVLPQVYSQGFTAIFIDANGGRFSKTTYSEVVVKRSWAVRMKNVEYTKPQPLETANCYVIDEAGYQMFPAFGMGNRQDGVALFSNKYSIGSDGTTSDGGVAKADLLWTDVTKDLPSLPVDNIEYVPAEDGKGNISFRMKKDPSTGEPYRGNAVIALYIEKDGVKTIVWTWHLWMTEEPQTVLVDGACDARSVTTGGNTFSYWGVEKKAGMEVMDRNLGAISSNPSDGWKTYGLFYQMGRKDPFPGADYSLGQHKTSTSYSANIEDAQNVYHAESTPFSESDKVSEGTIATWVNTELAPNGFEVYNTPINLSFSFANPLVFSADINKVGSYQYVWTNVDDADDKTYAPSSKEDPITGLKNVGHEAFWNRTKTIFDPCPSGWTVLGENTMILNNGTLTVDLDNRGFTYEYMGSTSWWPFAGCRTYTGYIGNVGWSGYYIDSDHINADHGWHGEWYTPSSTKSPGYKIVNNDAASIRCVRGLQTYGSAPKSE